MAMDLSLHMAMAQNYQHPKWIVFLLNMIISVGHWYHNFEPNPYPNFGMLRIPNDLTPWGATSPTALTTLKGKTKQGSDPESQRFMLQIATV